MYKALLIISFTLLYTYILIYLYPITNNHDFDYEIARSAAITTKPIIYDS